MTRKQEVIILIIAAAVLTGFWWGNQKSPAVINVREIETSVPSIVEESVISEETDQSGVLVYRDKKYGFELQHPATMLLKKRNGQLIFPLERLPGQNEGFYVYAKISVNEDVAGFKWREPFKTEILSFNPLTGAARWTNPETQEVVLGQPAGTTASKINYYKESTLDVNGFSTTFFLPLINRNLVLEFRVFGEYTLLRSEELARQEQIKVDNYIEKIENIVKTVQPS